jgi:malate synthase
MEDAATAEISRTQLWQWLRYKVRLDDGRLVDAELYDRIIEEEVARQRAPDGKQEAAAALLRSLIYTEEFPEFLTLPAYDMILEAEPA